MVEGAGALSGVRVEQAAFESSGVGEPNSGCEALAEGPGSYLDAIRVPILRMSGCLGTESAESLQVVDLEAVTAEEQLRVEREGTVADRQDEPIPTDPLIVTRVPSHDLLEEKVGGGGHAHRGARMAIANFLHRIGR